MAKPIIIIGVPNNLPHYEYEEVEESLGVLKDEYYIIVYPRNDTETTFEVFYEKDFNHVKFEELKEIIKSKIEN